MQPQDTAHTEAAPVSRGSEHSSTVEQASAALIGAVETFTRKGGVRATWPCGVPPKGSALLYQGEPVTSDGELFVAGMLLVHDASGQQIAALPGDLAVPA